MTDHGSLPEGVQLQRITDEFTVDDVPPGLLRAHRIAAGSWGRLQVIAGPVRFVEETEPRRVTELDTGDTIVISPGVPHHVEPGPAARFRIEFHR